MIEQQLPILLVAIPLFAAPLCVLIRDRRLSYALTLVVCWMTFAVSVALLLQVQASGTAIRYNLGGWNPPYGIEYVVDHLSAFVMLFVSFFGAIVMTYAPASIRKEIPQSKQYLFFATYLLCMTGLLGICITGDLFNVFVFLEISSLSSYALISLGKARRAPLAAFHYLIMGTIGATFILIGIGLLYQMTGTLNMADIAGRLGHVDSGSRTLQVAFAFMTIGLCIKMAVFPLHTWLPNAYTYAPSVVTAFIAATATKVSVYALIRLVYIIFTPSFAFLAVPMGTAIAALSLVGIFVASTAAIYQDNIKRLLAFSSIAQIGYMLLGVGLGTENGLAAGVSHMFNHALIKGGLFMVMGCFLLRLGSVRLVDMRGAGRTMPWTSLGWVLGGLGLIGVPLTCGFVSKWMLLTAALEVENWLVAILMLISSLLALVYIWRVVEALYFSEEISEKAANAKEAPLSMLIPMYVVIGASILFGIWTDYSAYFAHLAASALMGGTP